MFSTIYNLLFYKPLLNCLVWLVSFLPGHDIGIAVIILTLFVRAILFPFTHKAFLTQAKIKKIEPELKKIKEEFKKDNQGQAKRTMELYKEHGISPFSGILTLFIQIPIILALYRVFLSGVVFNQAQLYSFITAPATIGVVFLGMIDITKTSYLLAFLAGVSHFIQMMVVMPTMAKNNTKTEKGFKDELARSMNMQMKYVMPIIIFIISIKLSGAIALYWTTNNVFAIVHGIHVKKLAEK